MPLNANPKAVENMEIVRVNTTDDKFSVSSEPSSPTFFSILNELGYDFKEAISSNIMTHCQTYGLEKEGKDFILKIHYDAERDPRVYNSMSKQESIDMWMQEVGLLKQIEKIADRIGATDNIPHIAMHFPVTQDVGDVAFLILERSPEKPLKERMTPLNPLADEEEIKTALHGFLKGLSVIHQAGRAHRDINDNNLLFSDHGTIIDLNFARAASLSVALSMVTRTGYTYPPYALGGFGNRMQSADLYALGVTLIAASQGQPTEALVNPYNLNGGGYLRVKELTANMSKELSQFFTILCATNSGPSFNSATDALAYFEKKFLGHKNRALEPFLDPEHSTSSDITVAAALEEENSLAEIPLFKEVENISTFRSLRVNPEEIHNARREYQEQRRAYLSQIGVPEDINPTKHELVLWETRYNILSQLVPKIAEKAKLGWEKISVLSTYNNKSDVIGIDCSNYTICVSTLKSEQKKLFGLSIPRLHVPLERPKDPSDILNTPLRMLCEDIISLGHNVEFVKGNLKSRQYRHWGLNVLI